MRNLQRYPCRLATCTIYNGTLAGLQPTQFNGTLAGLQPAQFNGTLAGLQPAQFNGTLAGLQPSQFTTVPLQACNLNLTVPLQTCNLRLSKIFGVVTSRFLQPIQLLEF